MRTPPATADIYAEGLLEFSNRIGVDGFGLGEQDLALGKTIWDEWKKKVRFPLISSNLLDPEDKPYFSPTSFVKHAGITLGIFSLLSEQLFSRFAASSFPGFRVADPLATARSMVKKLRPKSDLVILLSHLGLEEDKKLAAQVEGIDLIFGAHPGTLTHLPILVNKTLIMQLTPQGKYLGRLEVTLSGPPPYIPRSLRKTSAPGHTEETSGILWYNNLLVPMSANIAEDPGIAELVRNIKARLQNRNRPVPLK